MRTTRLAARLQRGYLYRNTALCIYMYICVCVQTHKSTGVLDACNVQTTTTPIKYTSTAAAARFTRISYKVCIVYNNISCGSKGVGGHQEKARSNAKSEPIFDATTDRSSCTYKWPPLQSRSNKCGDYL